MLEELAEAAEKYQGTTRKVHIEAQLGQLLRRHKDLDLAAVAIKHICRRRARKRLATNTLEIFKGAGSGTTLPYSLLPATKEP